MIIVEGPDGSGKSTLIEQLGLRRITFKSMRNGVGADPNGGGWNVAAKPVDAFRFQVGIACNQAVAFDRFHLSEVVYGPILRGVQLLPEPDLHRLNAYLRKLHIQVVLCLPPFLTTFGKVMTEGRPRPGYQTPEFLKRSYDEFVKLAPYATIVYDFTRDEQPFRTFLDDGL